MGLASARTGIPSVSSRFLHTQRLRRQTRRKPSVRSLLLHLVSPQPAGKPSVRSRPLRGISSLRSDRARAESATGPRPFSPPGQPPHLKPPQPTAVLARPLRSLTALLAHFVRSEVRRLRRLTIPRPPFGRPRASPLARPSRGLVRVRCSPARSARRFAISRLSLRSSLAALTLHSARSTARAEWRGSESCAVRKLHSSLEFPTPGGLKGRTLRAGSAGTLYGGGFAASQLALV